MRKFDELQLRFDIEGFEEAEEGQEGQISPEEARQISEAARIAFESTDEHRSTQIPGWFEDYLRLRENGWPWRVGAYIAWASSPRNERWPGTLKELATEVLGLTTPRSIYNWRRKYPAIDATIAMLQAAPLWEHRRDVIEAMVAVATDPDYKSFNDRKLFLEMVGDYTPRSRLDLGKAGKGDDMTEMGDEELRRWLAGEESDQYPVSSDQEEEDDDGADFDG